MTYSYEHLAKILVDYGNCSIMTVNNNGKDDDDNDVHDD